MGRRPDEIDDFARPRRRMVRDQLEARGIRDPSVLRAMAAVPRQAFVAPALCGAAYDDSPLAIEAGQTISQPFVVALMIECLEVEPGDRVLEIGTGSGYAAAVLGEIAGAVFTVERHAELARTAAERLAALGYANVHVRHGDGTLGWPEHAPYDGIVVAASGPAVPRALREQLAPGGTIIEPVGDDLPSQRLVRMRRDEDGAWVEEDLGRVAFVPLIGEQGWRDRSE